MNGCLCINTQFNHLSLLDGKVAEDVDFGYGILGRLDRGGWFQMHRVQVSPTEWKTDHLEIHMYGRALLVKSFSKETSETRGGFQPVPPTLSLNQGTIMLEEQTAKR
jgi:hypothetical protein